jgi:hypothetical protein
VILHALAHEPVTGIQVGSHRIHTDADQQREEQAQTASQNNQTASITASVLFDLLGYLRSQLKAHAAPDALVRPTGRRIAIVG